MHHIQKNNVSQCSSLFCHSNLRLLSDLSHFNTYKELLQIDQIANRIRHCCQLVAVQLPNTTESTYKQKNNRVSLILISQSFSHLFLFTLTKSAVKLTSLPIESGTVVNWLACSYPTNTKDPTQKPTASVSPARCSIYLLTPDTRHPLSPSIVV